MIFEVADGKVESLKKSSSSAQLISIMIKVEHSEEDWFKLCQQAAVEQDPDKLIALTREICRLLDERQKRLKSAEA